MAKLRLTFAGALIWVVAVSVSLTVLLSIPVFWLDIHFEQLTDVSGLTAGVLRHNYNVLMAYELWPGFRQLAMPDFPDSASALKHFAEVRVLFTIVNLLTLAGIPVLVRFVKLHLHQFYRRALSVAMAVPVALAGIAALTGFDTFFIAFHKVLFRDNTWLFNPDTDPIINVLTDNFFLTLFVIFAIIYETILFVLYVKNAEKSKKT